ncbi:MAG: hypothetical protein RDV48_12120 [Candidatus Eremiobacteraeota bacterium]|nr:hypothetical protein [Candidatus Eremiobacteraeota bacterium]
MQKFWKKKGLALASIMLVMLVLSLLAVSVVGLTTNQYRYSLKKQSDTLTMQAALAGLNAAEKELDREATWPLSVRNWDQLAPNSNLVGWTRVGEKNLSYRVDLVDSTADTCTVISTARLEGPGGSIDKEKKVKATFKKNCFLYAAYGNTKNDAGVTALYNSKIIGDIGSSRTSAAATGKVDSVIIGHQAEEESEVTHVAVNTSTMVNMLQESPSSATQVNVSQTTSTTINSSGGGFLAQQNQTYTSLSKPPPSSSSPSAMLSLSLSTSMTTQNFVPPITINQSTSLNVSSPLNPFSYANTTYSLNFNKKEVPLKADEPAMLSRGGHGGGWGGGGGGGGGLIIYVQFNVMSPNKYNYNSSSNSSNYNYNYNNNNVNVNLSVNSSNNYQSQSQSQSQTTVVSTPHTPTVTPTQQTPFAVSTPHTPTVTPTQQTPIGQTPTQQTPIGQTPAATPAPQSSLSSTDQGDLLYSSSSATPSTSSSSNYLPPNKPFSYTAWYNTMQTWSINNGSFLDDTSQIIGDIYVTPHGNVEMIATEGHYGAINNIYVDKLTNWKVPVPSYNEPVGLTATSAIADTITGGTYLYDSFDATGRTITIDASKGPVILYVRQRFSLSGSTINFASGAPCDPRNLIVYCSSYCSVSIKDESKCSLLLAAPSTDIDVQGKSYVVGSLLGNKVKCHASVIEYPKGRLKDMRDRALLVAWEELP